MSQADDVLARAVAAATAYRTLDQTATDEIVRSIYLAALTARVDLAAMAHEETGIGIIKHKVIKNVIATQLVYEDIKGERTVGIIADDPCGGILELAQPIGPILAFIPITNPTSTTLFKALIAAKTRNPIILSPPQAARRCTVAAAHICFDAAREAGAPEGAIQWLEKPSPETMETIMSDHRVALILATGTDRLVRKAQRSGRPVLGVGPGNVPVYIGASADVPFAIESILESKLFDHGSVCASEQAVVVKESVADRVIAEFERQGAYFLTPEETARLERIAWESGKGMNPLVVGQPAPRIARAAGFEVPDETTLLIATLTEVGPECPLSAEILAPILAFYVEREFDESIRRCSQITWFGGMGHTAVIYSNTDERIEYFSRAIDAGRILVNMPATQGALGGIYNSLRPSFTLSCGSGGGNITTDNITTRHLLNIHRITRRRPNPRWFGFETDRYLDPAATAETIAEEYNHNF